MRIASLVLVILLAFTFSCGPIWWEGNKFDATKRDQIVKNRTTAQELESLLGKPYKVEKRMPAKRNMSITTIMRNISAGTSFRKRRCRNSKSS